jgi:hypothetical protein
MLGVMRMTPSFANALTMTLQEEFPNGEFRSRVTFSNANDTVMRAINDSIGRYDRGIRLSTQLKAKVG